GKLACECGLAERQDSAMSSGYVSAAATTVGVITCRTKLRARACKRVAAERTTSGSIMWAMLDGRAGGAASRGLGFFTELHTDHMFVKPIVERTPLRGARQA